MSVESFCKLDLRPAHTDKISIKRLMARKIVSYLDKAGFQHSKSSSLCVEKMTSVLAFNSRDSLETRPSTVLHVNVADECNFHFWFSLLFNVSRQGF